MRRSLSLLGRLVMVVAVVAASAARAQAITLREIVELTKAGLSDEVLLALIEVDQRVFSIDSETVKSLQDAGVSPARDRRHRQERPHAAASRSSPERDRHGARHRS